MTATVDETTQVVQVGALVVLDANVLSHGIGFFSHEYPPLILKFEFDDAGLVKGYSIDPVEKTSPKVERVNFVKVGEVLKKKPKIIGVQKTPKLIIPGA